MQPQTNNISSPIRKPQPKTWNVLNQKYNFSPLCLRTILWLNFIYLQRYMSTEMLENYPRLLLYTLFTVYMKEKVRILARTMQLLCN